jgi:hypothetical protein
MFRTTPRCIVGLFSFLKFRPDGELFPASQTAVTPSLRTVALLRAGDEQAKQNEKNYSHKSVVTNFVERSLSSEADI